MAVSREMKRKYWLAKLEQEALTELRLDKATEAKVRQALGEARGKPAVKEV